MGHERDYKVCRNHVTRLIRSCEAKHYQESVEASRGDPRLLSNIFKDLQKKPIHQNAPTYIRYHNNTLRKDIDIADSFNEFFSGIATTYLGKPRKNTPQTEHFHLLRDFVQSKIPPGNFFNIPPVREDWVRKTLLSLDKNKATGMDTISSKMLKIAASLYNRNCNQNL